MTDVEKMTEADFLALFAEVGADLTGHFVLASWRHSNRYFNKKLVFDNDRAFKIVATALAHRVMQDQPDFLVAPQSHGVKLAQEVQWTLSEVYRHSITLVPAEKGPNESFFISNMDKSFLRKKRVVFIEDILTTGGSIKKVITLARELEAELISLHAFVNRGDITAEVVGVPKMTVLAHVSAETWAEEECPQWLKDIPVNETVGRGKEYMDKKRAETAT